MRIVDQVTKPLGVGRIEIDEKVGTGDCFGRGSVTKSPRAVFLLCGVGCFGNDVGDAKSAAYLRPDQVWRLVVEVIGEPKIGAFTQRAASIRSMIRSANRSPIWDRRRWR